MKFFASLFAGYVALALIAASAQASNMHHGVAGVAASTTLDPANTNAAMLLSGGNLTFTDNNIGNAFIASRSIASAMDVGVIYGETKNNTSTGTDVSVGVVNSSYPFNTYPGNDANSIGCHSSTTTIDDNGGSAVGLISATWNTAGAGVAWAFTTTSTGTRHFWCKVLGSNLWNNSGTANPATDTGGIAMPAALQGAVPLFVAVSVLQHTPTNDSGTINFGGQTYSDTPPAGSGNLH